MLTCSQIETAVANHFGYCQNIIVPNVSWGLFHTGQEVDVLVVRPSGYAIEVEIKISASDIKADLKKRHAHNNNLIKMTYFAVPSKLAENTDIPVRFGVLSIDDNDDAHFLKTVRAATANKSAKKLSPEQILKVYALASMRIWSLKKSLISSQNQIRHWRDLAKSAGKTS